LRQLLFIYGFELDIQIYLSPVYTIKPVVKPVGQPVGQQLYRGRDAGREIDSLPRNMTMFSVFVHFIDIFQ